MLDDAPLLGKPVEIDSDQMETLIENNECATMWEMADMLKISKSIKILVKMKKSVFYFMGKPIQTVGQCNMCSLLLLLYTSNHF